MLVRTNLEFELEKCEFCVAGHEEIELIVFARIAPGPVWVHGSAATAKVFMIAHFATVSPDIIAPISHSAIKINFVREIPHINTIINVYAILCKMTARISAIEFFNCVWFHNKKCSAGAGGFYSWKPDQNTRLILLVVPSDSARLPPTTHPLHAPPALVLPTPVWLDWDHP